jgi:A/G-specific adenine glycosylase
MSTKFDKLVPENREIKYLRSKILKWFKNNKRTYPWRRTKDPYKVLIAEMMLRRTKADQVASVYTKFLKVFPDVQRLARADQEELRKILYPLGLKWRIPAFKKIACEIVKEYSYKVPKTKEKLLSLPGVGDYVAGAVLSIAFNKKEWIVDSNVVRLFRRYFGISTSKEGRRDKHVIQFAKIYSSCKIPKEANLAMLDFTALICLPREPSCLKCPVSDSCFHYTSKKKK